MSHREPAVLVLEDGTLMRGAAYGAHGFTFGEAVFATGMTGYQETLTDPSYHRQIVVMTAPHVGNTGVNDEDQESSRIWVSGYVVRDPSRNSSNWRATRSLERDLIDQGVVGVCEVDTRAITRRLRDSGAMRMGIFSGELANAPTDSLLSLVLASPGMTGADLAGEVSTPAAYLVPAVGEPRLTVAAMDLGMKTMTPRLLAERGVDVHVLPASTSANDVLGLGANGVFFSNGPGDPSTADHAVAVMQAVLGARVPVFGICFGHQILGRALGLGTYKLRYGHRGINQPVQDLKSGKIEITAHNHGFAVDAPRTGIFQTPFGSARVSHVCSNDDVVEGLECLNVPAFSVQYHPEAAAGPHDASHLFDEFINLMQRSR